MSPAPSKSTLRPRLRASARAASVLGPVLFAVAVPGLLGCASAGLAEPPQTAPEAAIPAGYRDWRLVSVAHEEGDLNDIRAILGNDIAIHAYREGLLPFPDGAIIARLAWDYVPSTENNQVFGRTQSFVAGLPKNGIQFMVKDARKHAATGGWGYAHFDEGKPADPAVLNTCFACHQAIAAERDQVFTRYSR